ncbi:MAG TPA: hypothetical protein VGS07_25250 [Thermoanaerobaculia bacterium]|jgi:hypothetical protein|nr:hypothetical protein [Thermoanaerobaculia bacterium]
MTEPTEVSSSPEAPAAVPPPEKPAAAAPVTPVAKPAPAPAAPPRPLPSPEEIGEWIHGADLPTLAALFDGLPVAKFDILVMQVRKEELVPQHWQVISDHTPPDDLTFDRLAEVGRLRVRYKDQELSRRRVEQLRLGWRELGGLRPAMWTVADLLAAMRRIIDKKRPVDWNEFLAAQRDIWRDLALPHGKEQTEVLWNCLVQMRKSTKK